MRGSPWSTSFTSSWVNTYSMRSFGVCKALDFLMSPPRDRRGAADGGQGAARRQAFFATNGTSPQTGLLQTLIAPGEKLLLDRNCHKSVHHGVVLSGRTSDLSGFQRQSQVRGVRPGAGAEGDHAFNRIKHLDFVVRHAAA